jgi:hypothetical protein
MNGILFPERALSILRAARWDPNASYSYEIMSGGFAWSDERLAEAASICTEQGSWAFRVIMGYRTSLIRQIPREELRSPWDQLLRECPDWPGFRPERRAPSLAPALDREWRKTCVGFRRLERRLRQQTGRKEEGSAD